MKILHLIFTGLGTSPVDANGDPKSPEQIAADCGMAETVDQVIVASPSHTHTSKCFSWDGNGSPDANCRAILALVHAAGADRVYVYAHSFGNSLLMFLLMWLMKWHQADGFRMDLAFGFDPCRNFGTFGHLDWDIGVAYGGAKIVRNSWCWYNTDPFRVFGVVGTPFKNCPNIIDVTDWTSPKLAHIDVLEFGFVGIPDSDRIRTDYVLPSIASDLARV